MKGKIYAIKSHKTKDIYYGSTIQKLLSSRLSCHKNNFKNQKVYCSSYEIIKYNDAYIELVEEYDCDTKEQLKSREGYYIRNNDCVNKNIPDRTMKEWYIDNKEKHDEKCKLYNKINKETISLYQKDYQKDYYEINKNKLDEDRKDYQKKYREMNRKKLNEKQNEKRILEKNNVVV